VIDYTERIAALPPESRALLARDYPLSFGQQRLWFLDRLEPGSAAYNIPCAFRMTGPLDLAGFERAVNAITERHEVLRTSFHTVEGQPLQVISPRPSVVVRRLDLSALPEAEREAEASRLATEEAARPFDLARGPLLRVSLLRLGCEEYVALCTMHHIISDGWSSGLLMKELSALYRPGGDEAPALPEPPIQYADYARWERDWFEGGGADAQLNYWRRKLAGTPALLELPTDRPRPPVQSRRGARHLFELPAGLGESLSALGRREGATLFMTVLAAFQALLHKYGGQDDLVVGTPVACRGRRETEGLIGFFVNTVVVRADLSGDPTFAELLRRVRSVALEAYAHQQLPFDKLVQELVARRDLSHAPLFQVLFDLQGAPAEEFSLPGLRLSTFEFEQDTTKFDLALSMLQHRGGVNCSVQFNTDIFDAATVERMFRHFQNLLRTVAARPGLRLSEIELLSEEERRALLSDSNQTACDYPAHLRAHELFERWASETPTAAALSFDGREMSYAELDAKAARLARRLAASGVGPDVPVVLYLERSFEMVVGLLGTLKAGGAYVPLDPAYVSRERLAFVLEDTSAPVLLTERRLTDSLPAHGARVLCLDADDEEEPEPLEDVKRAVGPSNLAYVIYTSGSTGRPKGVMVEHGGLANLVAYHGRDFGVVPGNRVLQFASQSFDASVWEVFMTLGNGATLCLAQPERMVGGRELAALLVEERITVATLPPSVLSLMPDEGLERLRLLFSAGEACPPEVAARWSRGRDFYNAYGPTETTVCATAHRCDGDERVPPIGRPVANAQLYVLDSRLRPVPVGVAGELYVGGAGIARGYLKRPDLTAEKFIPDPFSSQPGARLYRTGDQGRHVTGGAVEYLGRADHQVKVRGFRVELGEIEAALNRHEAVRESAVVLREDAPGDKRLVAYVATEGGAAVTGLREFAAERLPAYMVPSAVVALEELPHTASGKVDRKRLPAPEASRPDTKPYQAPGTRLEELLANIWAEALGLDHVGIDDNFFDLGGHSLLAVKVQEMVSKALAVEFPLIRLFQHPNVRSLAQFLEGNNDAGESAEQSREWAERRRQALKRQRQMRSRA
jgi:amino acid adenylation domain-containing protein